jgi:imidazolonepropionase-like amidohydrolase
MVPTLLLALVAACSGPTTSDLLVIENATIIDGTDGPLLVGHSIVIRGSRIIEVGPADEVGANGATRVDATGAFVIPGLWDMHTHLSSAGRASLGQYVASGVTGVRDLGGDFETVRAWRSDVAEGTIVGPQILTAGTIIEHREWLDALAALPIPAIAAFLDSNPRVGVDTPDEARAAIDALAGQGVDLVKLRNTPPPETFRALAQAADEHGLDLVAHLPQQGIGILEGIDAGLDGIEHMDRIAAILDTLDSGQRNTLLSALAGTGAHVTPTLVVMVRESLHPAVARAIVGDTLGVLDPRRRMISDELLGFWEMQQALDEFDSPNDSAAVFGRYAAYVGEMQDAGVRLVAGTDLGARLVYPGESVHDELGLLVEQAGLSPLEALQTATRNAAIAAGVADSLGTIREGHVADLVILSADPLEDIRNTKWIREVVLRGELLDRNRLASILRDS